MIRSSVLFVAAKSTKSRPAGARLATGARLAAANFCMREWRPRTPVSYYLERALMGRRANFASRGRRPTSIGAWLLDTGYRLSKGRSGNSQGAMVALGPDGLGGASSVIRCAEATCLEEGSLVTGPVHMTWTNTHGWPCNEKKLPL